MLCSCPKSLPSLDAAQGSLPASPSTKSWGIIQKQPSQCGETKLELKHRLSAQVLFSGWHLLHWNEQMRVVMNCVDLFQKPTCQITYHNNNIFWHDTKF